ncbi:MAG: hypothetical protein CSA85_00060 [Alphaproteobacteria bacterium]|nr:MAG: hypothetical protein CSA85_00060 [Alphaproteobacteria bacterium]
MMRVRMMRNPADRPDSKDAPAQRDEGKHRLNARPGAAAAKYALAFRRGRETPDPLLILLAQDLMGAAKLSVLPLQRPEPVLPGARQTGTRTGIAVAPADPRRPDCRTNRRRCDRAVLSTRPTAALARFSPIRRVTRRVVMRLIL